MVLYHNVFALKNCSTGETLMPSATNRMTQEQFLARCREVHGDRYDYSKTVYVKMHDKVVITCKEHGDFQQKAMSHVQGQGCKECGKKSSEQSRKSDPRKWVERINEKFPGKFDLTAVLSMTNTHDSFVLTCPEHGEFKTTINRLLHPKSKYGCPSCGRKAGNAGKNQKTHEQFIAEVTEVHKGYYDYSLAKYTGVFDNITIICPVHGKFEQEARVHLSGHGCPDCFRDKQKYIFNLTKEEFVRRARERHGDKFCYDITEYTKFVDRIKVTCKIHGEFETTAQYHVSPVAHNRGGCPECEKIIRSEECVIPFDEFERRAKSLYGDTYQYKNYLKISSPVTIVCPKHGEVQQDAYVHLRGSGCPICSKSKNISTEEVDLYETLAKHTDLKSGDRKLIAPLELDMVCHEHKFAVEYCGLYWHSDRKIADKRYHITKQEKVEQLGYRLFTVFSDEWINNREIVESIILRTVGLRRPTAIGARKCSINRVSTETAKLFYLAYHLQGYAHGAHYGLFYGEELVACATVGRRGIYGGDTSFELIRFCQRPDVTVTGGLRRLCLHALTEENESSLVSYVDRRWFTGSSYHSAGFELEKITGPGYWYVRGQVRASRFSYAKHLLANKLEQFDPELSEVENMRANGWHRLFDCGQKKFKLTR